MNHQQINILHQLKQLSSERKSPGIDLLRNRWHDRYLKFWKIPVTTVDQNNRVILTKLGAKEADAGNPGNRIQDSYFFAWPAAAILVISLSVQLSNRWGAGFFQGATQLVHLSRETATVTPGLWYGEIHRNTKTIRTNYDTIKLGKESIDTDLATKIQTTSADLRFEVFRDGIGIRLIRGEVLFNFSPGAPTQRYIIFPGDEIVTITGTEVYARIDGATKQVYLRHGSAKLESPHRGTTTLKTGKLYMLGTSMTQPVTKEHDAEIIRHFGVTAPQKQLSPVVRQAKKRKLISYDLWVEGVEEGTNAQLKALLREFKHVYKVFLPDSRFAYLGQEKDESGIFFSPEYEIHLPEAAQYAKVKLK
jgi:hypothetical protein